jgi:hypothetical protein
MFLSPRRPDCPTTPVRHRRWSSRVALGASAALLLAVLLSPAAVAQNFGAWSPATSIDPGRLNGVNTNFNDGCPIEAPDGGRLFIATNRVGANGLDIWVAYRDSEDSPWGDAEPLPAPVNTTANEFCPTPLPGNRLLFVRAPGSCGGPDIYQTRERLHPSPQWTEPEPLPCGPNSINSAGEEFSPSLVQDNGRTILFFSSNRDTQVPMVHKIYSSEMLPDGTWTPAALVQELSAWGFSDARPNVRKDGLEIVFDSTRQGGGNSDIYIATRDSLDAAWSAPQPLPGHVNSDTADESRPSLSRDGTRLYFGSTRANAELGGGGADIYVSTRSGPDKGKQK